ncbi:tetratricopeptide repeat protein [Flavilitoribacter nigricans]|nr:tetratricopeptide repeat protein [Flavilitoribacter nigricans]
MRYLFLTIALVVGGVVMGWAQPAKLAQQYYQNGEYEKAASLYEQLYQANERNPYYFDRYVDCLIYLEQYDDADKVISRQLRKDPENVNLYVTAGRLYERQMKDDEAKKQYEAAIDNLPANQYTITRLANAFLSQTKYDLAIKTYEKGAELLKDEQVFAYNLGDLYRRKGDIPKMIENYLSSMDANPDLVNNLKVIFQRYLTDEDYRELQAQLYQRIQDNDRNLNNNELLTWVFIQRKDYRNALRQVKALDRRLRENGGRIFRLGEVAADDGDYDAAIDAFDYIVEEKPTSTFYIDAKREGLRNRRNRLVEGYSYTEADLRELESQYASFLEEFGKSRATASIILEMAELEALYINDLDKATSLLQSMIELPGVDPITLAWGKINLADYYLMQDEIWESTLLYSQVDKDFKEDLLGHEARFRNAKLSYYNGDFQWAQAQFDVLKASTSKLIANDALDLSVFIMDNLGLDTTATAMEMYAQSELLVFQNRFDDAFRKLDSLLIEFPDHSLDDDVLYLKARIFRKQRNFEKTAELLQKIIDDYNEESIRTDNSLFQLAELYENQFDDKEKAKSLYETLFIDYSGSTFAVEARKRFRILRGDKVQ